VLDLLDGAATASAVGAALELGLFWLLDASPLDTQEIADRLAIPVVRCGYWLQLLARAGLLERDRDRFRTSAAAREAILAAYGHATWALLAEEARERLQALVDLPRRLRATPAPGAARQGLSSAYARLASDASAAARFTRMLYEVHQPLARELAGSLDLGGVTRLMDLGGGSGVMSVELARRHPSLAVTVVDVATVCETGRDIVAMLGMSDRISFHAADIVHDPLPGGFDVVLECDVNVYGVELFGRVREALDPGGRYLIVDGLAASPGEAPPSRVHWAFTRSMVDPGYAPPSLPEVRAMLEAARFSVASERPMEAPRTAGSRLAEDLIVVDARCP
jgi:SAM-dependent methyltransferase